MDDAPRCALGQLQKIVSGGQTGADRAALEAAEACGLATGGWVPRGRRAEDGTVPERYRGLEEADSDSYARRTELNVRDSDATLIVCFGPPRGGTALTRGLARRYGRPALVLDMDRLGPDEAVGCLAEWLHEVRPRVLNVAGPRASQQPRIGAAVRALLVRALSPPRGGRGA